MSVEVLSRGSISIPRKRLKPAGAGRANKKREYTLVNFPGQGEFGKTGPNSA